MSNEDIDEIKEGSSIIPESIMNSEVYLASLGMVIQFLRNKLKQKIVLYYDNPQFRKELELTTNL